MKRILVTGATGFVGRALLDRLAGDDVEVVALVRRAGDLANLTANRPRLQERFAGDLTSVTDWAPFVQGVDGVVHLAARVHQMNEDPAVAATAYTAANVDVTRGLAEAAKVAGASRFVFVSSIKVNGEGGDRVYRADDPPEANDPYGRSKREAEEVVRIITASGGMTHTILRPPLMYGPGVKANLYKLLQWVDRGRPWPFGAMRNRRSLLYVGNMADAIATALSAPGAAQHTYLLSDGHDLSTADLLRAIAAAMDRQILMAPLSGEFARILVRLAGRDDLGRRLFGSLQVDSQPFRDDAGWKPPFTVAQGMQATVDWYRSEQSGTHTQGGR